MTQQYEAITERLVDIIATIKLELRSGKLTVKRGEGLTAEEGMVVFARGQVIQATVGRRSGSDALNWLSTWRQTRYTFMPAETDKKAARSFTPLPAVPLPSEYSPAHPTGPVPGEVETDKLPPAFSRNSRIALDEVPYTMTELGEATARMGQIGLSRLYRSLYLLIDGRRSIGEIAHLVGKPVEEVRAMLRTLARLGIIHIEK